ncbi:glyoxal oxidase N-terminus-domain-containing protein [Hysterangium stoloniferum]|nr:glyoxal oxidase N-terminus-domain-containing protein [Hysterangium stoloniferum]
MFSRMSGVAGQQMAIVSETKAVIYDKVEHNPVNNSAGVPGWAVEYDITNDMVRVLNPQSNSFCAGGAHLSNGTLVNTGGNPVVLTGDLSGLQAIRLYTPCDTGNCDVFEDPSRVRLTSPRWYPSAARLDDGSVIVFGGSFSGAFINGAGISNPTYEFFPPKNINGHNGLQIPSQFLKDTLNGNHFPIIFELPDGTLFIAANNQSMIFNWRTNTETRLPHIPNGVRVTSPFSAAAVLLPLSPQNNYTPEVLICGGSTVSDTVAASTISSQTPTSNQCIRMVLNAAGITAGWQVETMPQARIMGDAILLPDGRVTIVDGAQTGVAGYGNVKDQIGQSNADNPSFQAVNYDPTAPAGSRFSQSDLPISTIARLYHSVATLTPNGSIMITGSNPNLDVTTVKFATEYRVEWLSPSYLNQPRPSYMGLPATVDFGTTFTLVVTLPPSATNVTVSLMDLGFSTHGVHMDQRLVQLASSITLGGALTDNIVTLSVEAPPNGMVYPPGPGYLYVVTDTGVPSFGHKVIIGTGASPPVDQGAIDNMLAQTHGQVASIAASVAAARPTAGEGSEGWYTVAASVAAALPTSV